MATQYTFWFDRWYEKRKQLQADAVGQVVLDLTRAHQGNVPADVLIAHAQPANSPLHPAFEWDDKTAADEHRRHQAQELITNLRITKVQKDEAQPHIVKVSTITFAPTVGARSFRVQVDPQSTARPPTRSDFVDPLQAALVDLQKFFLRYRNVGQLEPVLSAIKRVLMEQEQKRAA